MPRKRLRFALLAVVLAGLGGIVLQVYRSVASQKDKAIDSGALDGMLPQAVQWIQDFHRVEIRDGRKVWEVEGEEAQYLEESQKVLVRAPKASMYLKEGDQVTVRGGEATLRFDGQDLHDAVLRDGVEIHFRDLVIRAPRAVYDRARDKIVARGAVTIDGERLHLAGTNMVVLLKSSKMHIRRDVRVTLRPGANGAKS